MHPERAEPPGPLGCWWYPPSANDAEKNKRSFADGRAAGRSSLVRHRVRIHDE